MTETKQAIDTHYASITCHIRQMVRDGRSASSNVINNRLSCSLCSPLDKDQVFDCVKPCEEEA